MYLKMSLCVPILSYSIFVCLFSSYPELNTGQIQEGVGEAINGIVKHFHKPEKEVRDASLDGPQHVVLLFITNEEKLLNALVVPKPLSYCGLCGGFTLLKHIKEDWFQKEDILLDPFS